MQMSKYVGSPPLIDMRAGSAPNAFRLGERELFALCTAPSFIVRVVAMRPPWTSGALAGCVWSKSACCDPALAVGREVYMKHRCRIQVGADTA